MEPKYYDSIDAIENDYQFICECIEQHNDEDIMDDVKKITNILKISFVKDVVYYDANKEYDVYHDEVAGKDNVYFVAKIILFKKYWLQNLKSFKGSALTPLELIQKLFVKYEAPKILSNNWKHYNSPVALYWYILAVQGHSLYCYGFPIKNITFTKRMVHTLLYEIKSDDVTADAIIKAQFLGLGGSKEHVEEVVSERVTMDMEHNAFWLQVMHFFVNNPEYPIEQIRPTLDYIEARLKRAEEPNFFIKGRTQASMLRHLEAWHKELANSDDYQKIVWKPSGYKNYQDDKWEIVELNSSKELLYEGKVMRHCVGSYLHQCQNGLSIILSLRNRKSNYSVPALTVEIQGVEITQIRGFKNRSATSKEMKVINKWAKQEGLEVVDYVSRHQRCRWNEVCFHTGSFMFFTISALPIMVYLFSNASHVNSSINIVLMHLFFMHIVNSPVTYVLARKIKNRMTYTDSKIQFIFPMLLERLLLDYMLLILIIWFFHYIFSDNPNTIYWAVLVFGYGYSYIAIAIGSTVVSIWENTIALNKFIEGYSSWFTWRWQLWL